MISSLQYINNVAARIYNNICVQYTQLCCRSVYLQEYINTPPSTPRILSGEAPTQYHIIFGLGQWGAITIGSTCVPFRVVDAIAPLHR